MLASTTAALHANMEHIRVPADGRSPLDDLDADALLSGRPTLNPCNQSWVNDINRAANSRGLVVMLTGHFGNLTLTDSGLDGLDDLARARRLSLWLHHARALTRAGTLRWRGVFAGACAGRIPGPLLDALRWMNGEWVGARGAHSALRPDRWPPVAGAPTPQNGFERRLAALSRIDPAPYAKVALGRWGIDVRDPLTDRRLVEFCLAVPWEQRIAGGRPRALARRALADRLPTVVLDAPTRGYQGIDWHEGLAAGRAALIEELDRLARCASVTRLIDVARLRRLAERWPTGGWARDSVVVSYRSALLRGVAVGRFIRRSAGANA